MPDTNAILDDSDDAADELEAIYGKIADDLSTLSEAQEVPHGFKGAYDPFGSGEVDFDSNLWILRVIQVQAWLNLEDEVPPSLFRADPTAAAQKIMAGLSKEDRTDALLVGGDIVRLLEPGAESLSSRIDTAVRLQDEFATAREDGLSEMAATNQWRDSWEAEMPSEGWPEPIQATTGTWYISDFASRAERRKLNLRPSYQRGDVWSVGDSQKLIESVLRGIPLPSIILLTEQGKKASAFEVVDGKQRLTSILRFMGRHPEAIRHAEKAKQATLEQTGESIDFPQLLKDNYPKFRKLWKLHMGGQLTGSAEAKCYFPFKLKANSRALESPGLRALAGKYYCQIKSHEIEIAGGNAEVFDVFESATEYKIPVIQFTNATPRQIHEVFNLYNRQGKKLTAEEIRNALFHDVSLARLLLMASGDFPFDQEVLRVENLDPDAFREISKSLDEYRFGTKRYKRTKVLSWMVALLLCDSRSEDGTFVVRSTARQIDALFEEIQGAGRHHHLAEANALRESVVDLQRCIESHQAFGGWTPKFKDNKNGVKWQELQLVASLVGTFLISMLEDKPIDLLESHQADLVRFCNANPRPEKTQNKTQWEYIARVALGIADIVSLDLDAVGRAMESRYGANCIPSLRAASSLLDK